MIISCYNCNKKFDIDSNLIPDKGRLLQCASCEHKWFFKKEVLKDTANPIVEDIDNNKINVFDQNNFSKNDEINSLDLLKEEVKVSSDVELDKKIVVSNEGKPKKEFASNISESITVDFKPKKQKNFKILNVIIVIIISFIAFIIIVDTFKYPIGLVVPNIEFILYNLYESIRDISLFIKDLI